MEITITKSEYDELVKTKSLYSELEKKVCELQEESKNKAKALEESREKLKVKTEEFKTTLAEKEEALEQVKKAFDLQEWEDFLTKVNSLKENNDKYFWILKQKEEETLKNIEAYKKHLWEDYLKEKSSFLDWLSLEKTEFILKEFAENNGYWKTPKVEGNDNQWSKNENPTKTTETEKLLEGGASFNDLVSSLN